MVGAEDVGYNSQGELMGGTEYKFRVKKGSSMAGTLKPKRRIELHSRAWNDRFSVTHSKDNDKYHTFYKEFFDKNIKQKPEHITFIPKPQDPEVISKIKIIEEVREPLKKVTQIKKHLAKTMNWQHYHNVMASKNNQQVHMAFKEFFDRPIKLDPNGYHL